MKPVAIFACATGTSLTATVAAYALGNYDAALWLLLGTLAFLAFMVAWWRV